MRVVVLAGGLSTERDVSITSGIMVAKALRKKSHSVILLDVFMGYENDECDIDKMFEQGYDFTKNLGVRESIPNLEQIKASRNDKSNCFLGQNVIEICRSADITFLALHGDVGENGKLQAAFDILGIKYTGSGYLGSALAMNKGLSKSVLLSNGISTPTGRAYKLSDKKSGELDKWGSFPCVVKPCSGGSSVGVAIPQNKEEFIKACDEAFKYEEEIIVETYVKGRELSIGVIGGKALPIIEIIPKEGFYDYVNKYQSGKTDDVCPAQLDEKTTLYLQSQAEKAYKALRLEGYARIDFLLDDNGMGFCLEANTLPGMTPLSLLPQEAAAIGIDYPELCEKIIEISLEKYNKA